jgi:hypothetical protein
MTFAHWLYSEKSDSRSRNLVFALPGYCNDPRVARRGGLRAATLCEAGTSSATVSHLQQRLALGWSRSHSRRRSYEQLGKG